jgi:chemotaxis protein MotB
MKRRPYNDAQPEPSFAGDDPEVLEHAADAGPPGQVRHRGSAVVAWGFVVILLVAFGFMMLLAFEPLKQQLHATQALLADANRNVATLQRQVSTLEVYRGDLQKERDGLAHQVGQREAEMAQLQAATQQLNDIFSVDIDRGNITVRQMEGELVVDVANDLLFASGESNLSEGGKLILRKAAAGLGRVPKRVIEVGGHTDTQPLAAKLIRHFPTNWELSCARAAEVVRFFEESGAFAADHLVAAGYAGTRPVAENDHAPGRRRNQRIELILRPAPQRHADMPEP